MGKKGKRPKETPAPDEALANALAEEPDRGCVLVGASYLEYRIERLLRAYFKGEAANRTIDDNLVRMVIGGPDDTTALLNSSWARSTALCLFGIIDQRHYRLFNAIRKLRNAFAHTAGKTPLNAAAMGPINEAMAEIHSAEYRWDEKFPIDLLRQGWALFGGDTEYSESRLEFMYACSYLDGYLRRRAFECYSEGDLDQEHRAKHRPDSTLPGT